MATGDSPTIANGGRVAAQKARVETRTFVKECSVLIDVGDNHKVKAIDIINSIDSVIGEGSVFACVPKSGSAYELTLDDQESAQLLLDGVTVSGVTYDCRAVAQTVLTVSFMHLPAYLSDDEIGAKLHEFDVDVVGNIRRRYYTGTTVADGTRYMSVKLPPTLRSLPYSMKFNTARGQEYFRVIHDNQIKMCRKCNSPDHVFKDCPDYFCYQCLGQGHKVKFCTAVQCGKCRLYGERCKCVLCEVCGALECTCDEHSQEGDANELCDQCGETDKCECSIMSDQSDDEQCDKCGKTEMCECGDDDSESATIDGNSVDMPTSDRLIADSDKPSSRDDQAINVHVETRATTLDVNTQSRDIPASDPLIADGVKTRSRGAQAINVVNSGVQVGNDSTREPCTPRRVSTDCSVTCSAGDVQSVLSLDDSDSPDTLDKLLRRRRRKHVTQSTPYNCKIKRVTNR
jgi:hypothetical protein